jgi:ribosomal protein L35AE/L33A
MSKDGICPLLANSAQIAQTFNLALHTTSVRFVVDQLPKFAPMDYAPSRFISVVGFVPLRRLQTHQMSRAGKSVMAELTTNKKKPNQCVIIIKGADSDESADEALQYTLSVLKNTTCIGEDNTLVSALDDDSICTTLERRNTIHKCGAVFPTALKLEAVRAICEGDQLTCTPSVRFGDVTVSYQGVGDCKPSTMRILRTGQVELRNDASGYLLARIGRLLYTNRTQVSNVVAPQVSSKHAAKVNPKPVASSELDLELSLGTKRSSETADTCNPTPPKKAKH